MKRNTDSKNSIDSAHGPTAAKQPHDRDQLRRRLLKMILQSEAQRRGLHPHSRLSPGSSADEHPSTDLVVFDPEDHIGQELAVNSSPPKRA